MINSWIICLRFSSCHYVNKIIVSSSYGINVVSVLIYDAPQQNSEPKRHEKSVNASSQLYANRFHIPVLKVLFDCFCFSLLSFFFVRRHIPKLLSMVLNYMLLLMLLTGHTVSDKTHTLVINWRISVSVTYFNHCLHILHSHPFVGTA